MPGHAAAGRSGVCGASIPVFGGVVLDLCAMPGIVARRRRLAARRRAARHLRRRLRGRAARRPRPHRRPLAPVDGAVDRRRLAGVPWRRPVLDPLRQDRGHGRRPRGRAGRRRASSAPAVGPRERGRPRPQPALRRQRGHARRHHRGPAARPSRSRRPRRAPRRSFAVVRRRPRGLPAHPPARRHPGRAAPLRRPRVARNFGVDGSSVLLVLDEGDPACVDAVHGGRRRGVRARADAPRRRLVERWLGHRNDVSRPRGGRSAAASSSTPSRSRRAWSALPAIYREATAAVMAVPGRGRRRRHQSHAYTDGACLYFTFAGQPPRRADDADDASTAAAWDAVTGATLDHGGALSHHHGVGLNRGRFMAEALGDGLRRARRRQGGARPATASSTPASSVCRRRSAPCRGRERRASAGRPPAVAAIRSRRVAGRRCWSLAPATLQRRAGASAVARSSLGSSAAHRRVAAGRRARRRPAQPTATPLHARAAAAGASLRRDRAVVARRRRHQRRRRPLTDRRHARAAARCPIAVVGVGMLGAASS